MDKEIEKFLENFGEKKKGIEINKDNSKMDELKKDLDFFEELIFLPKKIILKYEKWENENFGEQLKNGIDIIEFLCLKDFSIKLSEKLLKYFEKSKEISEFIKKYTNLFQNIFPDQNLNKKNVKCFYLYLCSLKNSRISNKEIFEIHIICSSPKIEFKKIMKLGIKTLILSSGTLRPFTDLENSLEEKFCFKYHTQINKEIIRKTMKIIRMPNFFKYNSFCNIEFTKKKLRNNSNTFNNLFEFIFNLKNPKKGGVLVFLSSYYRLEKLKQIYINSIKNNEKKHFLKNNIFFEDQKKQNEVQNRNFPEKRQINKIKSFFKKTENEKAILFLVFRGKYSEGVNFKGNKARMAIIVGIPYPFMKEPRIEAKKYYLKCDKKYYNWLNREAFITINQAVGRIKRKTEDYGCVLLIDSRFKIPDFNKRNKFKDFFTDFLKK